MTKAYQKGREAFLVGWGNSENPYPSGQAFGRGMSNNRVEWFNGWYDAKFAAKYPHLFGLKQ